MATALEHLELLRVLEPNWDGCGAHAPSPECIDATAKLLRENLAIKQLPDPFVMPTRAGQVLLSWKFGTTQWEVEIEPPGSASFKYFDSERDETGSGHIRLDLGVNRPLLAFRAMQLQFEQESANARASNVQGIPSGSDRNDGDDSDRLG